MIENIRIAKERKTILLIEDIVYSQQYVNMHIVNKPLKMNLITLLSTQKNPVLFWIEGGSWSSVNPKVALPELVYYAEKGFAVVTIEYRLSHESPFPASVEDVIEAVNFIKANADRYFLDTERMGIFGRSAGGNMASLVSGIINEACNTGKADIPGKLSAVVNMFAVNNFDSFYRYAKKANREEMLRNVQNYLGRVPDVEDSLTKIASPSLNVKKAMPPHFIIHGTKDPIVPVEQSIELHTVLEKEGIESRLLLIEDAGHGTEEFDQYEIKDRIISFFKEHLLIESEG